MVQHVLRFVILSLLVLTCVLPGPRAALADKGSGHGGGGSDGSGGGRGDDHGGGSNGGSDGHSDRGGSGSRDDEDHGPGKSGRSDSDRGDDGRERDRNDDQTQESRSYKGGWRERIENGSYEVFDPAGRLVIRRPVTLRDYLRF